MWQDFPIQLERLLLVAITTCDLVLSKQDDFVSIRDYFIAFKWRYC